MVTNSNVQLLAALVLYCAPNTDASGLVKMVQVNGWNYDHYFNTPLALTAEQNLMGGSIGIAINPVASTVSLAYICESH